MCTRESKFSTALDMEDALVDLFSYKPMGFAKVST